MTAGQITGPLYEDSDLAFPTLLHPAFAAPEPSYIYIRIYTYVHLRKHTYLYIYTHTRCGGWMDGWMDGWMHGCIRIYICIHKHKTLNPKPYVSISTIRCTHSGIWCHRKAKASLGSGVPGFRVQRFRIWGLRFFFEV